MKTEVLIEQLEKLTNKKVVLQEVPVKSSNLKDVTYDNKKKELKVIFLNDTHYTYKNVPSILYNNLLRAPSKGKYLNKFVKGKFNYIRTEGVKRNLNECIILAANFGDGVILAKNRDRTYKPNVEVIRTLTDKGIEIVYLHDDDTDWMEGMNSAGIGIVNTALIVDKDDNELELVKKRGKKFDDGKIILKALEEADIKKALKVLLTDDDGLRGHTLISDDKNTFAIEFPKRKEATVTKEPLKMPVVRTNHGVEYVGAGYKDGEDYLSSVLRKAQILDNLETVDKKDPDIFKIMSTSEFPERSSNNVVRITKGDSTTSQMVMNLKKLEFNLKPFHTQSKFKGIIDNTPKGYKPKIKIKIIEG